MRVDLSLRGGDGTVRDVAVFAGAGTCLAELRAEAPDFFTGPLFSDGRPLPDDTPLGAPGLCSGSVVSTAATGVPTTRTALQLRVVSGPAAGRAFPLAGGTVTVGRAPDCDATLPDARVSRRHASLTVAGDGVWVRDLGSTNGVRIDGTAVGDGRVLLRPGAVLRLGDSMLSIAAVGGSPAALRAGPDGTRLVNRPPRLRTGPVSREIAVPEPEVHDGAHRIPWLAALLPAVAGGVLALTMRNTQFLVFAFLSPALLIASALGDRVHWRRDRRKAARQHRRQAAAVRREIADGLAAETTLRRDQHPDPAAVLAIASRPEARLWERAAVADDALTVRLGMATLPALMRARQGSVVEPAGCVAEVPLVADLRPGPLGIVAPAPVGTGLAGWLVAQLAVLHSPAEVEIALLLSEAAVPDWEWTRWLPHLRGRVAVTPAEHHELVSQLVARLATGPASRDQIRSGPWLVLVVDRSAALTELPGLSGVLAAAPAHRVTAICVDTRSERLPNGCATLAQVAGETGTRIRLTGAGSPDHVDDDRAVLDEIEPGLAEAVARALAPLGEAGAGGSGSLPQSCRLLDVLGVSALDPEAIRHRWSRAGGAGTVLGIGADGPVTVDLVRDGPHALIAGTTGAGKSELLQSLVVGLAATHPPDAVSFVLVDYKGGAAFGPCARLPHTTGLVTDLDPHLTARALRSLDAELRRRESLFAQCGATDLESYRAARPPEPLARLVLVVDEFAALAEELPGFVSGLVGVAQRGRSLGIHLVLATQRPGGVVSPEIRANTALRIALRVTDPAESSDVIGSDVAATIGRDQPGRAFVRAGATLAAVQVAWAAAPARIEAPHAVRVEPLDGWRRVLEPPSDDDKTELQVLVDCIGAAATASGLPRPRSPWLPPLPERLTTSRLGGEAARPRLRIGLVDQPAAQAQVPLIVDLASGGSMLVVGGARSGRSTALSTIALTASARLGPRALHIHALDFGGALSALEAIPHRGTLVGRESVELIAILLTRLAAEVASRQRRLAALGATSLTEATTAGCALPFLLLLIDGWEAFVTASEDHDLGQSVEVLLALVRSAAPVGLTVVITGDRGALTPRVAATVASRLVLRLTDRADFALAGIPPSAVPVHLPPGRAVRAEDGAEVQLAHVGSAASRAEQHRVAADVAARWRHAEHRPGADLDLGDVFSPIRVRPLPTRVRLADLPARKRRVVLGVAGDDATPAAVDPFAGGARLLVAGPARSGRSTLLRSVLRQVTAGPGFAGLRVVVAAPRRSPLHAAASSSGVPVLAPDDQPDRVDGAVPGVGRVLLLVDDSQAFLDSAIGDRLVTAAGTRDDLAVVLAGRTDELLLTYRGLGAEVRRAGCAVVLQPAPGDGELVGLRLPRQRAPAPPGRGVLIGDPAWGAEIGGGPVRIQVAMP